MIEERAPTSNILWYALDKYWILDIFCVIFNGNFLKLLLILVHCLTLVPSVILSPAYHPWVKPHGQLILDLVNLCLSLLPSSFIPSSSSVSWSWRISICSVGSIVSVYLPSNPSPSPSSWFTRKSRKFLVETLQYCEIALTITRLTMVNYCHFNGVDQGTEGLTNRETRSAAQGS